MKVKDFQMASGQTLPHVIIDEQHVYYFNEADLRRAKTETPNAKIEVLGKVVQSITIKDTRHKRSEAYHRDAAHR